MIDNHFRGNGNTYIIIQIVAQSKDKKEIDKPEKEKKSFWDKVRSFFSGFTSIIDFIKKCFPLALMFISNC
jgi:hypothetical protein